MTGYFIVQTWNNGRTIYRNEITDQEINHAIQRREVIIDVIRRRYYDVDLKRWIPSMLQ